MGVFTDLLSSEAMTSVRRRIVEAAQSAELLITAWVEGDVAEQMLQVVSLVAYQTSRSVTAIVRGYASLDTSTDPGDVDPYDPDNEDLEPEPGFLSNMGESWFSTPRQDATFASGYVTFNNTLGIVARTFAPDSLTFTWTGGTPPSPAPTYRNSADDTIYTNPDGTVTVAAGASLDIPVTAEEIGTRSNAHASTLSLTTTLSGVTATNASPIIGTDREAAGPYRERCRQAPSRMSMAGPPHIYAYLAKTKLDGTPLLNASGNQVNITRVQVIDDSDTGDVDVYFASGSGAASSEDVAAANANIELESFSVPGTRSYTGQAASEVPISVGGTAKLASYAGASVADAKQAIVDALTAAFATYDIGGKDRVAGAGKLYTNDFQAVAANAYKGLYDLEVTTPVADETALAKGNVGTITTTVGDWSVTLV